MAAVVFGIAAATDGLDGYVARTRKQVTRFGKLIDPIADKLLISAALLTLGIDQISAWIAVIIIGREFAASDLGFWLPDQVVIAASVGKAKTLIQIIAVLCLLLDIPYAMAVMWLAVLVTIVSGVDYFYCAQDLLKKTD